MKLCFGRDFVVVVAVKLFLLISQIVKISNFKIIEYQNQTINQVLIIIMTSIKESEFDRFIIKCESIAKDEGFDISVLLSSIEHSQLFKMVHTYSQSIINRGTADADQELKRYLTDLLDYKLNKRKEHSQQVEHSQSPKTEAILINKEREKQRDQLIISDWKQTRRWFYEHEISDTLKEAGATQEEQQSVIELFLKQNHTQNSSSFPFSQMIRLRKYEKQIQKLQQTYCSIQSNFQLLSRDCMAIQDLIQLKYSNLKVIKIQYQQQLNEFNKFVSRYSISAFTFFQFIHANRLLTQVTVLGVELQRLKQFLKILNPLNEFKVERQLRLSKWVSHFRPSKSLKLAISCTLSFKLYQSKIYSQIDDLRQFCRFFGSVSNIIVQLVFKSWSSLESKATILMELWKCLKVIQRIHIQISIERCQYAALSQVVGAQEITHFRALLFGGLASLITIVKLSFNDMKINNLVPINDFFALEQTLATIFLKNSVQHLQICQCYNFPLLPQITTLHSIDISNVSFQKKQLEMDRLAQTNKNLKSAIYMHCRRQWNIDKPLFNSLHHLVFNSNIKIQAKQFRGHSISNIKELRISYLICFRCLVPNLHNLISLTLKNKCGHQIICTIPSPYLEQLKILFNDQITDKGLRMIDNKWPKLRHLQIKKCSRVTEAAWSICEFKGLIELKASQHLVDESKGIMQLQRRGVKVTSLS